MFESVQVDETAARFRSAAVPPLAALIATLLYITLYPLLPSFPSFLFWTVVAVLFAASVAGAWLIVREVRRARPRGRDLGWCIAAALAELACARVFLVLTFPWL